MDDKRTGKLSEPQFYAMLHILMTIKKAKEQFTNNFVLPQCLQPSHISKLMRDEDEEDTKDEWDGLFLSNNTTSEIVNYYTANQAHQRSSTVQSVKSSSNGQRLSNVQRSSTAQRSSAKRTNVGTSTNASKAATAKHTADSSHNLDAVQNWADFSVGIKW